MLQLMTVSLLKKIVVVLLLTAGAVLFLRKLLKKPEEEQTPVIKDTENEKIDLVAEQKPAERCHIEENEKTQDSPQQNVTMSPHQLLRHRLEERNQLERYACYAKLFSQFLRPLQILLGLDDGAGNEWMDRSMMLETLQEDVAYEMRSCLRRAGGRVESGKIWLPLPDGEEADVFEERIGNLTHEALEANLKRLQLEIEELQVYSQRKALIENLTGVYETLLKLADRNDCSQEQIRTLAKETEQILRSHGVYAMYYEDPRLTSALAGRFALVSKQQLVYPGLFVKAGEGYRQLGSRCGTRREQ